MDRRSVAVMRLGFGAELEAYAAQTCAALFDPAQGTTSAPAASHRVSQLYFDAYAAAVWTSAHAEYVHLLDTGHPEPSPPSIFGIASAFTALDMSEMYTRRTSPKSCPKTATVLLQLLSRCSNPGSRGWHPVLAAALKAPGPRRIFFSELQICLLGLHPSVHPAARAGWEDRFKILRVVACQSSGEDFNTGMAKLAFEAKEIMRRALCTIMDNSPAMHTVLSRLGHPVRHLHQPPQALPHASLESSMMAFANAGKALVSPSENANGAVPSLLTMISTAFEEIQTRTGRLHWSIGWMGKGTLDVGSKPTAISIAESIWSSCFRTNFIPLWLHAETKQVRMSRLDPVQHTAISQLNAAARLCALLPEAARLSVQRLALQTPAAGTLDMHQAASLLGFHIENFKGRNSGPRTVADAVVAIGVDGPTNAARFLHFARVAWLKEQVFSINLPRSTTRRQAEAVIRRTRRYDPHNFNPKNFTVEELLADAYDRVPVDATHLCVCTECQRVANAFVERGSGEKNGRISAFNELGCTQSMVRWTSVKANMSRAPGCERVPCMHCAKRSSAALRTSMTFQAQMTHREVEADEVDAEAIATLANQTKKKSSTSRGKKVVGDEAAEAGDAGGEVADAEGASGGAGTSSAISSGIAPRMRRDAKTSFEQRCDAVACTDSTMLVIKLLGRAVRIFGNFYTHCEYCASVVKLDHHHRYADKICCLRCDAAMLYSKDELEAVTKTVETSQAAVCRYCGAVDPMQSGLRWRRVKAPHDVAGVNGALPVPLRHVFYCGKHFKSWSVSAHKTLPTRTVLAHLALGCRPVFQTTDKRSKRAAGEASDAVDGDGNAVAHEEPKKKKKRVSRKLPKPKAQTGEVTQSEW